MNSKKMAFLFPGQGSQYVGMGKELYDNIPECKEIIDMGEKILNMPIKDLIFNGPEDKLVDTEIAQPAILLVSLAALKALEIKDIKADYCTGLSLGEYGALIYGGMLSFEDGIKLIKERGRIMGSALPKGLGKMAAILKLDKEKLEELLKKASNYGICEGANFNCPGQTVISGENEAIDKAVEIASDLGGRGIHLKVGGPFHSSLLKEASEEFYKTVKEVSISKPNKIVYSNLKGAPYSDEDDIKVILQKHIMTSVLFEETIRDMLDKGVDTFIEVGPGKALKGFIKKIDRKARIYNVEDLSSLENTINMLKEV